MVGRNKGWKNKGKKGWNNNKNNDSDGNGNNGLKKCRADVKQERFKWIELYPQNVRHDGTASIIGINRIGQADIFLIDSGNLFEYMDEDTVFRKLQAGSLDKAERGLQEIKRRIRSRGGKKPLCSIGIKMTHGDGDIVSKKELFR